MTIQEYLENVNRRFITGISREHSYRGDLQTLIESLAGGVLVTNEPARIKCGAPDFIITKTDIPVGYVEAKDIGKDLSGKEFKEQFDRYRQSLNNLIITDYLDFHLYIDGKFATSVKIAEIENGTIKPLPQNFERFSALIKDFCSYVGQTITNSKKLAEMMAGKARILAQVIEEALESDEETNANSTLEEQMKAFRDVLIHDLTPKEFADVYAQTIAYGMFAARLHDPNLDTFSRQEAAELIPKSNPFLRKLFQHIAGYDLDDRIKWIVDALADIFRATDVKALLKNFGKATQANDPIIHFYEDFLREYDPKLRKMRGVWYTPEPVVNFIVRAVDDILKTEFYLPQGLADTSKTRITLDTQTRDERTTSGYKQIEREVHRVQILDPATGTGTFLSEVVKQIYRKFEGQQGVWSSYVENHLIPRLNGFELLMASYTMAHLKLDMLLSETGYGQPPRLSGTPPLEGGELESSTKNSPPILGGVSEGRGGKRLQIYLTNSLEEHHPDTGTLFAGWLSREANEANHIKRDTPVMCVIGNPPYSGESANKGKWIMSLMEDYKKEPGGKEKLNEKNPKWINADEIKFIRFGQYFIEKNGEGILAFINSHSFLDNPTFRGMRWHLLKTYDKIFIIDLHGNSIKKETAPDGSIDQNVFDIKQGVSINIFVKTGRKKPNQLGQVFHYDLFGKRELKYDFLWANELKSINFKELEPIAPNHFFVQKNFETESIYKNGFSLIDLFPLNSVGIVTARDSFTVKESKEDLQQTINDFVGLEVEDAREKYGLGKDARDWKVQLAQKDLLDSGLSASNICKMSYRPFDQKWTYFTGKSKGFHCMPRGEVMKHILSKNNLGLVVGRQGQVVGSMQWNLAFITKSITDFNLYYRGGGNVFPLYLYPETGEQQNLLQTTERTPNLNEEIVNKIAAKLGLRFVSEKEETTPALRATPPLEGGEFISRNKQSSPPLKGGVSEGRGGFNTSASHEPKEKINNLPYLKTFRKELRNNLTPAEARFWKVVQNKNFEDRKFRRQHSVGNYILDFYCPSEKLAIELDGEVHFGDAAREYDHERRLFLEYYGIKVLRFENKLVFEDLERVLGVIKSNFGWSKTTTPSLRDTPPLEGGELLDLNSSPSQGGVSRRDGVVLNSQTETFAPIDILDYIYAILHSPAYREKYKEFLKIDFPRVPFPKDAETFWQLVALGGELRQIHLLESLKVEAFITTYPKDGDNIVTRKMTATSIGFELTDAEKENGRVWLNDRQYFDNVSLRAWEFYIGGYQPAQKWLKDRFGRELSFEDIRHYQKIIVALTETHRIMQEIDKIELE